MYKSMKCVHSATVAYMLKGFSLCMAPQALPIYTHAHEGRQANETSPYSGSEISQRGREGGRAIKIQHKYQK